MWQPVGDTLSNMFFSTILALVPILCVLVCLGFLKMKAYRATLLALFLSFILSITVWKMPITYASQAVVEGILTAFWPIIWVIIASIFTYNITVKTGGMNIINQTLSNISPDRRIQVLILAFSFGGFLEAAAGFGTAVVIPASLLAGIGFNPIFAAVICLIANTVPVAFGGIGIPVITLAQVTNLPLNELSAFVACQLIIFIVALPFVLVLVLIKSFKSLKEVFGVCLVSGISFALLQTLVAVFLGPELSAIVGSLSSLLCTIAYVKIRPVKNVWLFSEERDSQSEMATSKDSIVSISPKQQLVAWTPYIVLFVFIMSVNLIPQLKSLHNIASKVQLYFGPDGNSVSFQWITTPGTLMFLSAVIGGLIQGKKGKKVRDLIETFGVTIKQLVPTIVVVSSIVAMAKLMGYSGMTSIIAVSLASIAGKAYPFISPLIGALGTFVTGSDTSANILFGALQKQTAIEISANPTWLAAANTVGASAGKMISPQSIAIAASATGLVGDEGKILNSTVPYCLGYTILLGIEIFLVNAIIL
ncbi:L-lactate permease [Clostridium sp. D2Q-14]|uniref:L-lactate permease n=1 Tax=Anaeromonas gelatinilytica TaxID=2683194 RepID=UPI00193BC9ED|nr:L-lactate permease [Anaeromonas gelatinilytica]MBS4534781.1 L-lactate permease [Anaeromonas gelatinilytica]